MPEYSESRAPAFLRWLVLVASWIVPRRERSARRSRQKRELDDWWKLVDVGELTTYSSHEIVRNLKQTCLDFSLSRP
jgi:hypothetical protein